MKKIGIGYEDYKRFIDENMYYIDKTLLIRDVVEKGGEVTLFTRPLTVGNRSITVFSCHFFTRCRAMLLNLTERKVLADRTSFSVRIAQGIPRSFLRVITESPKPLSMAGTTG